MSEKIKIKELWLWCHTCKKAFKAFYIEFSPKKWILINPHEHDLTIGICPRTAWITNDYKEKDYPQLTEVFKLCEDVSKLKEVLKVLAELENWKRGDRNG